MANFPEGLIIIPPGTLLVGDRDESTKILEIVRRTLLFTHPDIGPLGYASATASVPEFGGSKPGTWEVFMDWNDPAYSSGQHAGILAASAGNGIVTITAHNLHSGVTASGGTDRVAFMLALRRP